MSESQTAERQCGRSNCSQDANLKGKCQANQAIKDLKIINCFASALKRQVQSKFAMLHRFSQNLYSTALHHGNKFRAAACPKCCSPKNPAALTCEIDFAETQHESV
jgi:hypothetical protein